MPMYCTTSSMTPEVSRVSPSARNSQPTGCSGRAWATTAPVTRLTTSPRMSTRSPAAKPRQVGSAAGALEVVEPRHRRELGDREGARDCQEQVGGAPGHETHGHSDLGVRRQGQPRSRSRVRSDACVAGLDRDGEAMTTTTLDQTPATTAPSVPRRRTLVLLAVTFVTVLVAAVATGAETEPDSSLATIESAYDHSRLWMMVTSYAGMAACAVLIFLGVAVRSALRGRRPTWTADVAMLGLRRHRAHHRVAGSSPARPCGTPSTRVRTPRCAPSTSSTPRTSCR